MHGCIPLARPLREPDRLETGPFALSPFGSGPFVITARAVIGAVGLAFAVVVSAGSVAAAGSDSPHRESIGRPTDADEFPAPRLARVIDATASERAAHERGAEREFESEAELEAEPQIVSRSPNFPPLGPRGDGESSPTDRESASPRGGRLTTPAITVASSLAVVLGLFAALVWTSRRFGGRPSGGGELPADAVERLGVHSLDPRTKLVFFRCGDRVLVIAQTASGVHPVTEIADPIEASRLVARCRGENAAAFTDTLRSMEQEPAAGGFVGDGASAARHRRTLFASGVTIGYD